jgi:Core-2/I-Branching enzyme
MNDMRVAFLIMAHKDPPQIERLLNKFKHGSFDFYIHLDKKTDIRDFAYLGEMEGVRFIRQRIKVRWAAYSFVHALLISFEEILGSGIEYDYISVMSGQDYPIKPLSEIYSVLAENRGKNFICYEEPDGEWWKQAISRVTKYHFTNYDFKGRYRLQWMINKILPERKFPLPYQLYGGPRAMCMTLTSDCCRYVLDFISANKKLRQFTQFTWGPDEFLIPTIIMNSRYRSRVENNNFYYIDWSGGGSNPKTLTVDDFEVLTKSDKFLARKFDIEADVRILDLIDGILFPAKSPNATSANF